MEFAIGIIMFSTAMAIGWTWAIRQRNKERIKRKDVEFENRQLWNYIYKNKIGNGKEEKAG